MTERDAWDWGVGRWEVYFALVLVSTIVYVTSVGGPWPGRAAAAVLLFLLVPWYLLVGRRTPDRAAPGPLAYTYVGGLVVLSGAAALAAPPSSLVLFALCPHAFMVLGWAGGVMAVLLLNTVPAVRFLADETSADGIVSFIAWAVVVTAFSALFARWIDRIIDQSAERRELIAQLESTRAELAEVSREAGVMAERERMAGEIHDTLAQGFTSILMLLQAADAHIGRDAEEARRQISRATRTARENLAEARALVAALPPAPLGGSSLDDAIRRITERLGEETGVAAAYTLSGEPRRTAARAEVVLLRVAQEGLANVRKHAKAGRVDVRLAYAPDAVRLEIADDGTGFDPGAARGFGLHGMRERAGQVGGTLKVRSRPGSGTVVTVEVPGT